MEVKAIAKYVRGSSRKIRKVIHLIQGRSTAEAVEILDFARSGNARKVKKVLKSAISNAKNNFGLSLDTLYVKRAFVDKGPVFKRMKPRARGRADLIRKKTSHITIILENRGG